jgi:uncharacterized RDD family membrane protein YckC
MVIEAVPAEVHARVPSAVRRICAFFVDYFLVAIYMGLVFFMTFVFTAGRLQLDAIATPWARQLLGAVTLTIPVVLYFALSEASARQGTIGKLSTRLVVTDRNLKRIGISRSLLRSALKFLPWELAHTFIHRLPKDGEVPLLAWAALAGSLSLAAVYLVGLFTGQGRPLYEVIAGTRVIEVGPSA